MHAPFPGFPTQVRLAVGSPIVDDTLRATSVRSPATVALRRLTVCAPKRTAARWGVTTNQPVEVGVLVPGLSKNIKKDARNVSI